MLHHEPKSCFVDTPHGKLHYLDWPANERSRGDVLLLHGFSQTCHSWDEFAAHLCEDHHVIALDQRGHGESSWGGSQDAYSREQMVHDAWGIAPDHSAVIGMSMGGAHAIALAAQYPQRYRCIVIVDYVPGVDRQTTQRVWEFSRLCWNSFEEAVQVVHVFNARRSLENIRTRLRHSLYQRPDGMWTWRVDPALAMHPRFNDPSEVMWQRAAQVQCPALMVHGGDSDIVTLAAAQRMAQTLPKGRLISIEGAGHSVPGDNPEAFYAVVKPFLDEFLHG